MKTKLFLFLIGIMTVLTSCKNNDSAIRQMCQYIHTQYPLATLQDIYKTCYQDFFGAEHLMNDTAAARYYINYELEQCKNKWPKKRQFDRRK